MISICNALGSTIYFFSPLKQHRSYVRAAGALFFKAADYFRNDGLLNPLFHEWGLYDATVGNGVRIWHEYHKERMTVQDGRCSRGLRIAALVVQSAICLFGCSRYALPYVPADLFRPSRFAGYATGVELIKTLNPVGVIVGLGLLVYSAANDPVY